MLVLNKRKQFTHKEHRQNFIGKQLNQRSYYICCKRKEFVNQQSCGE
jgi:hypothetical protein